MDRISSILKNKPSIYTDVSDQNPSLSPIKKASSISLKQQILPSQPNTPTPPPTTVTLNVKIEEFHLRIGEGGNKTLNIIVNLLTSGKVRVEFLTHIERLELSNLSDLMSADQAASVYDSYVKSKETRTLFPIGNNVPPLNPEFTGKIIINKRMG